MERDWQEMIISICVPLRVAHTGDLRIELWDMINGGGTRDYPFQTDINGT